jgi:hypothetical protein
MAKLNEFMSRPAPDLSAEGLAKLLNEQMSGLKVDDAELRHLRLGVVGELTAGQGNVPRQRRLALGKVRDLVHAKSRSAINTRIGAASTIETLRGCAASSSVYKQVHVVQPLNLPNSAVDVKVRASECKSVPAGNAGTTARL